MQIAIQNAMHKILLKCTTIVINKEVHTMAFQIKSDRKETENKTIRFPLELLERIENAIKENDVTFSGFVIQACEYALDNMEE